MTLSTILKAIAAIMVGYSVIWNKNILYGLALIISMLVLIYFEIYVWHESIKEKRK